MNSESPNEPKLNDCGATAQPVLGFAAEAQDVTARSSSVQRMVRRRVEDSDVLAWLRDEPEYSIVRGGAGVVITYVKGSPIWGEDIMVAVGAAIREMRVEFDQLFAEPPQNAQHLYEEVLVGRQTRQRLLVLGRWSEPVDNDKHLMG